MEFKRARKDEHIEQRKDEILNIARELCRENGVMAWSFNALGRRTSISKSNLYRYFKSREEVLMQLFALEIEVFVLGFDRRMDKGPYDIPAFSRAIAREYHCCPFLCELMSVAPAILEHHVDVTGIIPIKRSIMELAQIHGATVQRSLDWMTEEMAAWASQTIGVYAGGLWPVSHPSSAMVALGQMPEFKCMKVDFETQMVRFVTTLLRGMKVAVGKGGTPWDSPSDR